jgi:hypothetical protein
MLSLIVLPALFEVTRELHDEQKLLSGTLSVKFSPLFSFVRSLVCASPLAQQLI